MLISSPNLDTLKGAARPSFFMSDFFYAMDRKFFRTHKVAKDHIRFFNWLAKSYGS